MKYKWTHKVDARAGYFDEVNEGDVETFQNQDIWIENYNPCGIVPGQIFRVFDEDGKPVVGYKNGNMEFVASPDGGVLRFIRFSSDNEGVNSFRVFLKTDDDETIGVQVGILE